MELPCKLMSRGPYVGRILIVLALLCVAALQPAFGQGFTIKDLGTLPGGTTSFAFAINNRGQVVGEATTASGATHAFLFDDGVMVDLGTLPGGTFSTAAAINDRGQVVGTSSTANTANLSRDHAFLFENGVMVDLGTLPGGDVSEALGINNHGEIVGSSDAPNALGHATLWTPAH